MSSGVTRTVTGAVNSTGASLDVKTVGFRPIRVALRVGGDTGYWNDKMPDASVHKRVAAGTGSLEVSGGVTPLAEGFNLGTDSDLNPGSTELIYYECEG